MADQENQNGSGENQEEVDAVLTPVEEQALDSGWVPKDQYKGEEHKWVDAGEFLRRGELFKKIEDQSKQLKDVRNALNEMKKLHSQVREVEYKRALTALREQKKQALLDGDADAVIDVDERIDLVKDEQAQLRSEPAVPEPANHPEFEAWVSQNNWYQSSAPMRAFADALGKDLAGAGNSPPEVLRKVAAEVRKEFPHKFSNPNRDKPGAVETGRNTGATSGSKFVMSDEERRAMNTFVRTGVMTEKEYIDELKKVRG